MYLFIRRRKKGEFVLLGKTCLRLFIEYTKDDQCIFSLTSEPQEYNTLLKYTYLTMSNIYFLMLM